MDTMEEKAEGAHVHITNASQAMTSSTLSFVTRTGQITQSQKVLLVKFIKSQPNLQSGKFSPNFTKKYAQKLWRDITAILNAVPGAPKKTWAQWRKVCVL